ncbi:helix-turn-helix domain-containing protein [Paraburkholderia sp. BL9I2N2]|uniref:helix-turn-helix domain-containing protein n=1 Tax=Paraburkholderia sp. BL9I2N2 TaxID=1938809 RepID=UPI00104489F7|nr:helix-turn-helix domain-containing protein [Paraburkholderia sp. BL9I2N2]TCK87331.1 Cro/C1-type helix-turn-helix DNA-binding protein [Paraburkholderia sp. BL9I2N2]
METWNTRLAKALAESEYKPHQLAQALGVKTPSVSAWLGAATIQPAKNITGENLLRVCKLLNIRPEWLMFKEGAMRPSSSKLSDEMLEIIERLKEIDRIQGSEREDAVYFINRLLRKEDRSQQKAG